MTNTSRFSLCGFLHTTSGNEARLFVALPCVQVNDSAVESDGVGEAEPLPTPRRFLVRSDQWTESQLEAVECEATDAYTPLPTSNALPAIECGQVVAVIGPEALERARESIPATVARGFFQENAWTPAPEGFRVRACTVQAFNIATESLLVCLDHQLMPLMTKPGLLSEDEWTCLERLEALFFQLDLPYYFQKQQHFHARLIQMKEQAARLKPALARRTLKGIASHLGMTLEALNAVLKTQFQPQSPVSSPVSQDIAKERPLLSSGSFPSFSVPTVSTLSAVSRVVSQRGSSPSWPH